jgi:hypothetical protein
LLSRYFSISPDTLSCLVTEIALAPRLGCIGDLHPGHAELGSASQAMLIQYYHQAVPPKVLQSGG